MNKLLKENKTCPEIYCEKHARPDWISDSLMTETRRVWQKYYAAPLSESELIEIIVGVGQIF